MVFILVQICQFSGFVRGFTIMDFLPGHNEVVNHGDIPDNGISNTNPIIREKL